MLPPLRPDVQAHSVNNFQHPQVGIRLLMAGNDFLGWQWLYQRRYARKARLRDSEQSPVSWIIGEQSTVLGEATHRAGPESHFARDRAVSETTAFKANNLRFLFCSQSHITDP